MFRLAIIAAAINSVGSLSPLVHNLLRNARNLEQEEESYSWIVDYSLKYKSCHTITEYSVNGDGDGYLFKQRLIEFNLCPSNECGSTCEGGDYLAPMEDYVKAYYEQKTIDEERICEQVSENCECEDNDENDDEEDCERNCYYDAGADYCVEEESGEEEEGEEGEEKQEQFDIEDFLNCQELNMEEEEGEEEEGGEENEGNEEKYYVGLKCSDDGEQVNIGIFTDKYCTDEIGSEVSIAAAENLPYQNDTIITEDCVHCTQKYDEQEVNYGYDDDEEEAEASEMCLVVYRESTKCETDLDIYYPTTDGCELIENLYLREDSFDAESIKLTKQHLFAISIVSLILGIITIRLCCIAQKQQQHLNDSDLRWKMQRRF